MKSFKTVSIIPAEVAIASNCSGRFKTLSYSSSNGTETTTSNRRSSAASSNCLDAPELLRKAATSTFVSITCAAMNRSYRGRYHIINEIVTPRFSLFLFFGGSFEQVIRDVHPQFREIR